ncbi:uncharacterized protein LOC116159264 [Photinus pyralis]|uniref:uncharacterized protein LOC116159264 n=1 Tax=Photinus pyralis TaxID=7054 RepID=UPI00126708F5|nr:uncharacterized protein LOC116159264 [Photinus pyralis]
MPPRCSYYTENQRYIQEVIEKEEVRLVNRCCSGFKEDAISSTCVFDCAQCSTIECKLSSECSCPPGFWGQECDLGCPDYYWGPNCFEKCPCIKGSCNPITGYCNCPPGWKGSRCEEELTPQTNSSARSDGSNFVKSLTKQSDRAHYPTLQKYFTFMVTTHNPASAVRTESDPLSISTPKIASVLVSHTETTTEINDQRPPVAINDVGGKTEMSTESVAAQSIIQESGTQQNQSFVNNSMLDRAISVSQVTNDIVKEKVAESIGVSVTNTQTVSSEGSWLDDQSPADIDTNLSTHPNGTYVKSSHIIFSVGAVVGILATIIIIVAVTFLTTQNYKYKHNKMSILGNDKNTKNGSSDGRLSAVAIYTRSVFHTPLPEPPALEIPIFSAPLESRTTATSLQAHVVCSMHLQNETNNRKDARFIDEFYDHPPSTGSYRAASIPEPPYLQTVTSASKEHLYDEIPCWKHASENNALILDKLSHYANTPSHTNSGSIRKI